MPISACFYVDGFCRAKILPYKISPFPPFIRLLLFDCGRVLFGSRVAASSSLAPFTLTHLPLLLPCSFLSLAPPLVSPPAPPSCSHMCAFLLLPPVPTCVLSCQEGDAVLEIDGKPAARLSMPELRALISGAPGSSVRSTITLYLLFISCVYKSYFAL